MSEFSIRIFREEDKQTVIEMWHLCNLISEANNPELDIERKRKEDGSLFFVGEYNGSPVATCMAGYDGHRGWLYYLAVHPDYQKRHFGKMIVKHAEEALKSTGCPKIDLMIRNTNRKTIKFYEKVGYVHEPVIVMGKRLTVDEEYHT